MKQFRQHFVQWLRAFESKSAFAVGAVIAFSMLVQIQIGNVRVEDDVGELPDERRVSDNEKDLRKKIKCQFVSYDGRVMMTRTCAVTKTRSSAGHGRLPGEQRLDVKRKEKPIQKVIRQNVVQAVDFQAQDIVEVMEMIQMLSN